MTAEIINLRRARKRKARADAARKADVNRAKHGLNFAERKLAERLRQIDTARLDQARRAPGGEPDEPSSGGP